MAITTEQIKALRDRTGVSVMQCKKALEEAGGDADRALVILQKKSKSVADKKSDRELGSGVVAAYVHSNHSVGAMVELACETDFVAKNDEFKALAYEIAMHVAAMNPEFLSSADITEKAHETAKSVFEEEVKDKPKDLQEKILEGKMQSYFADKVLLEQAYIKDGDKKIADLISEATQKFGERTQIIRYTRFSILG